MHGREHRRGPGRLEPDAAILHHAERASEEGFGRRGAKAHDDARLHERDLVLEPRQTGADLAGARCLVNAALGTRFPGPLEVLDRIRDVHVVAVYPRRIERVIEQSP